MGAAPPTLPCLHHYTFFRYILYPPVKLQNVLITHSIATRSFEVILKPHKVHESKQYDHVMGRRYERKWNATDARSLTQNVGRSVDGGRNLTQQQR